MEIRSLTNYLTTFMGLFYMYLYRYSLSWFKQCLWRADAQSDQPESSQFQLCFVVYVDFLLFSCEMTL